MTERAHSEHGASICKRWWNCPGSVSLARGMPNNSSPDAVKGTAAHKLGELCLNSGQDAIDYVDRMLQLDDGTVYPCDSAMADAVQVYLDECRGPMVENCPDTFTNLRNVQPANVMVEARFDLTPFNPPAPMFGTADFVAYVPVWRKLFVKDYKNGAGVVVDAQDNPQLKYYALGAMLALGPDQPVSEIEVAIIQPNAPGRAPVTRAHYAADDLAEWSVELMARAAATLEPDAPIIAGDWCKFCPAAGVCTARAAANLAVARVEFADLEAAPAAVPEIRLLTPEQVGAILRQANAVEAWIADVRNAAHTAISRGETIPGWILVEGQARETWRFPDDAAIDLQLEHGFGAADIMEPPKLRSYAQIRDALAARLVDDAKAAMAKLTKKDAQAAAKVALRPLTFRPTGKATLAPASDTRTAIQSGGSEFLALPDTTESV